ncbi:MAG: hypothetical protein WBO31_14350 [Saprospiraceae bacterium]
MDCKRLMLSLTIQLFLILFIIGQNKPAILLDVTYNLGFPQADLKNRYGNHLGISGGITYQPAKNHFNFGLGFGYYFGSNVKEDVLKIFRTSFEGLLIGEDQYLAEMKLKERAYLAQIYMGGLIPIGSQKIARQSFKWKLGFGFLQHKIRFVDDARAIRQFTTEYLQGVDRLTNGFALIPFLGYEFLSRKGLFSFYTGIEPIIGFTQNQRNYNYDTNESEFGIHRKDILINFKIGIYLPFYLNTDLEKIEY